MKIVKVDSFNRETERDVLVAENVNLYFGNLIVELLNSREGEGSCNYFVLKDDSYKLWRGIEELL